MNSEQRNLLIRVRISDLGTYIITENPTGFSVFRKKSDNTWTVVHDEHALLTDYGVAKWLEFANQEGRAWGFS